MSMLLRSAVAFLSVMGYYALRHLLAKLLHLSLIDCAESLLKKEKVLPVNSPENLQFWQIAQPSLDKGPRSSFCCIQTKLRIEERILVKRFALVLPRVRLFVPRTTARDGESVGAKDNCGAHGNIPE